VAAKSPAKPFKVAASVILAPIADIDVGDRLRPVDPVWAAALGAVMTVEGQDDPIKVCRLPGTTRLRLVTGGHRLEGARLEGWIAIKAIVVDSDAIRRRQQEISENLWRKGLDPIDRATFVAELYSLQKAKSGLAAEQDGRSASIAVRWSKALKDDAADTNVTVTLEYGWAEGVADQIGLSRKTIYRDLELHRGLRPDLVAAIRGLPIASNAGQLRALAKMAEADQRQAVALIVEGTAKNATDALGIINQKPQPSPEVKAWSAFFGSWNRMSAAKRREALREMADQGLPTGVTINFEKDASAW
jgi:hypothetical protein